MKISLDEVNSKFDSLLSESVSREEISDWARETREAHDAGSLDFSPPSEQSRIWDAILYLEGVDLKVGPQEYLHSTGDFRTFFEDKLET